MSVVFKWKEEEFEALLRSCDGSADTPTPHILRYMPKEGLVLEAGCGMGRYVVYMSERGFHIQGLEIGRDAIRVAKRHRPETKVLQGDVARLPYPADSLSGIISLGVVEHFIGGPAPLLREMWRVLKPGHYAVITVPSFNYIRQAKYWTGYSWARDAIKRIGLVRRLFGRDPLTHKPTNQGGYLYAPFLQAGDFFEYRFTKNEFEAELGKAGFTIIESVPIAHIDGVYHEFGRLFVSFGNWEFHTNLAGSLLNRLLSLVPFLHNHMHLCVARKLPPSMV